MTTLGLWAEAHLGITADRTAPWRAPDLRRWRRRTSAV